MISNVRRFIISILVSLLSLMHGACLKEPNALDPGTNNLALLAWINGYQNLLFNLPACGYATPAYRVANTIDLFPLRSFEYSANNLTYNFTMAFMLGCTPATVTNSVSGITYQMTYHSNRAIKSRFDSVAGKLSMSTTNSENWITQTHVESASNTIDRYNTYDASNRIVRSVSPPDASGWFGEEYIYEYNDFSHNTSRGIYYDSLGGPLYEDAQSTYTFANGLLIGQATTCLGGSSCTATGFSYSYNAQGQLISESQLYPSAQTDTFTYDSAGRIAGVVSSSTNVTYTYNAQGQLSAVVESSPALTLSFTY
ncbi:MAG: hypothetical protein K8S54_16705 [Spirochaetia bacterium]|nr:hypothetical protein [Spirochaetia bacterium]